LRRLGDLIPSRQERSPPLMPPRLSLGAELQLVLANMPHLARHV
jgi:hypothetical protein